MDETEGATAAGTGPKPTEPGEDAVEQGPAEIVFFVDIDTLLRSADQTPFKVVFG